MGLLVKLRNNALVVVADGKKLNLFRNTGASGGCSLTAMPQSKVAGRSGGSGGRHHDSAANPAHGQGPEDDFAAGVADHLNGLIEAGDVDQLVLVAAPRTLGEVRKQLSKRAAEAVVAEIAKDLTGHSARDVEQAIASA